jgi:hypothetical protein
MQREDLNRFLASVRKTRFIDYLDPIGETAMQAFERRLRWAERSQEDAAHTDEATFLLENADDLRAVVRKEMEQEQEDDWVDAVDAGSENVRISKPKGGAMRESIDEKPATISASKADTDDDDDAGGEPTPLPGVRTFGPPGKGAGGGGAPQRPVPRAAQKSEAPAGQRGLIPPKAPSKPPVATRKATPTLLPEEPAEGQDPWDLEQTGIMRMEDVTPTPPQARSSLPKPTPRAAPSQKIVEKPSAPRSPDVGRRGTIEADVGWDDSAKGAPDNAPAPTSPGAARRSATPNPPEPPPLAGGKGATPAPVPAGGAPAIMQRRARGEEEAAAGGSAPAPARRRSRAPMALLGLLVAGASVAGVIFLLPMLQAGGSPAADSDAVAVADSDAADSDAVAELEDSDAADSDAVAEVEEDSDAGEAAPLDGAGAVVGAGDPPKADPPKTDPPKTVKQDPPKTDPPKTVKQDPPKTDPPKTDPPKTVKQDPPKADPPKSDPPKTDPPAEPVTIAIKGLWTGKIDGRALFLTITKETGNIVEGTAELQTAEGFMNIALAGTWDSQGQSLSMTGPDGAVFKASGKDGRLVGNATVKTGAASVTFSVGKK